MATFLFGSHSTFFKFLFTNGWIGCQIPGETCLFTSRFDSSGGKAERNILASIDTNTAEAGTKRQRTTAPTYVLLWEAVFNDWREKSKVAFPPPALRRTSRSRHVTLVATHRNARRPEQLSKTVNAVRLFNHAPFLVFVFWFSSAAALIFIFILILILAVTKARVLTIAPLTMEEDLR